MVRHFKVEHCVPIRLSDASSFSCDPGLRSLDYELCYAGSTSGDIVSILMKNSVVQAISDVSHALLQYSLCLEFTLAVISMWVITNTLWTVPVVCVIVFRSDSDEISLEFHDNSHFYLLICSIFGN